ncbi:MAG: putative translation initiation inhibitor, yjgF family [Gammaproteobacteria bacterium]|nr:putative translation initiation inhibitor, yjgF family [Gammaproteobacteria bacterium]
MKEIIQTKDAPAAIGAYSQAVKVGKHVYLSGQIPLDPKTMEVVSEDIEDQIHQVFKNLAAVIEASGGNFSNVVKMNVYLVDLSHFPILNKIMAEYVSEPYPARAAVEVSALPRGVKVEIEAVVILA